MAAVLNIHDMISKLLLLLLLPFAVFAQSGSYLVQGKIGPNTGYNTIYLLHSADGKTMVDSGVVSKGVFSFSGNVSSPVLANLSFLPPGVHKRVIFSPTQLMIYLEPGVISISSPDSLQHATVTGNKLSEDYQVLRNGLQPFDDTLYVIQNKFFAIADTGQQKEFFKAESPRIAMLVAGKKRVMEQFVRAHPGSEVSINVLSSLAGPIPEGSKIDSLYQLLSPEVKNTPAGKKMAASLDRMKGTEIGRSAPDFTQADTAGKDVSLHDFKGKYVLVDFWASWCVPCRADNPHVVKAYNDYKSKGFTVLSVSLDKENGRQAWLDAIKKDGLDWTHVSDLKFFNNAVAQLYAIQAIPQNFLIGPEGKIIAKNLHGGDLEKKLSELLGK